MNSVGVLDLNYIFTNDFDEVTFREFGINLVNLEHGDLLSCRAERDDSELYKTHIEYIKDIGKYKDEKNKTILISMIKLKDSPEKSRTMQRNFIAKHIKSLNVDAAVVGLYSENSEVWRISFVKLDYTFDVDGLKEIITPAKRYSYLIEPHLKNHTAQEQLGKLFFNDDKKPSVEEIENVFSVESVTDEFFKMYKEKYLDLKELLESCSNFVEEGKRLNIKTEDFSEEFAKKLMGQIAFLYFLQKKGWLGVRIVPKKISINELEGLYKKQDEETRKIIKKVYKRKQDNLMHLFNKELKNLNKEEGELLASVFKNTKYEEEWGTGTRSFIRTIYSIAQEHNFNFFNEYLEPLFYNALNKRRGSTEYYHLFNCKIPFLNGGLFEPIYNYKWEEINIEIPNEFFSNEEEKGLLDLFDMYNFTINEDEPLEKEIAVDPEMLGKIFENLLEIKERKSKGAFYTPREIVHYMCQESLINYLVNKTNIDEKYIELFIKYGDIIKDEDFNAESNNSYKMPKEILNNIKKIDEALATVRVADPAVGSGAFPLGMLTEIVRSRNILTSYLSLGMNDWGRRELFDKRSIYQLKKDTMKKSIFAVDIEPSAIDIAKLRLWLSLVVDAEVKTVNTLPNLDYNIMVGNSLIDEYEGIKLFDEELLKEKPKRKKEQFSNQIQMNINNSQFEIGVEQEAQLLEDIQTLQSKLFDIKVTSEKLKVKAEIEQKEWELIDYKLKKENKYDEIKKLKKTRHENRKPYFLWKLEFSKIFKDNGGFDIVIGNPPYIKIQNIDNKECKVLKKMYSSATGKFDIYVLFIEKAFKIIKKDGIITFIQPHRFLAVDYGKGIRKFLKDNKGLSKFINFGVGQVFDTATTYTGIFFFKNKNNYIEYADSPNLNLNKLEFSYKKYEDLGKQWLFKSKNVETLINKIKNDGINTLELFEGVYQGLITTRDDIFLMKGKIKGDYFEGYSTALDQDVVIEKNIMKPLLKGEHIRRYKNPENEYFVFYAHVQNSNEKTKPLEEKVLKDTYPLAYEYICNFKDELIERKKKYKTNFKYWYSMHRGREKNIFESEKIMTPQLQNYPNFTLDSNSQKKGEFFYIGGYSLIKKSTIEDDIKYYLGILNSKVLWFFIKNTSTPFNSNYYYFKSVYIEPFSFPKNVDKNIKDKIVELVGEVIKCYNNNENNRTEYLENEINKNVYKAYGFNKKEIELIEKN